MWEGGVRREEDREKDKSWTKEVEMGKKSAKKLRSVK